MESENKDPKIIKDFINGDNEAYTYIYNKYVRVLYSYGIGLNFEKETIKDSIHDVFLNILCNKESIINVQNLKYYLLRALKNNLLNKARSYEKKIILDDCINCFTLDVTVLDDLIEEEDKKKLKNQIESLLGLLTDRQREAIYLRYVLGLDYSKVSELLNISVPSARNIIAKGISKMRENSTLS